MGGVVARATLRIPNYVPNSIRTILVLNSPQSGAPVLVDRKVATFYSDTDRFWSQELKKNNSELSNLLIVSIGGGLRDSLIRSELTDLSNILPASNALSVLSTSIPNVFVSSDHEVRLKPLQTILNMFTNYNSV